MAGAGGQFYIIISAMAQLLVAIMAQRSGTFINKQTSPSPGYISAAAISRTISVNHSGRGDFKHIQQAIDSIPDGNSEWIRIHVAAGTYREKVHIKSNKPFIVLEGEGRDRTAMEWPDHYYRSFNRVPTFESATFRCDASDFQARNITFKNTYTIDNNTVPAVAAQVSGDRSAFYNCGFVGVQDTLNDQQGRHYYENCYLEGAVDFIFGHARSIFQGCTLWTCKLPSWKYQGFLTAQGRVLLSEDNGFVFKECTVDGVTPVYLGRGWRFCSTVIFYRTFLSNIIVPQGWDAWNAKGHETSLTMLESECTGPGSNRTGRVPWSRVASGTEVARFTDINYVSSDGWLGAQPH
nr:probable pectinesterase 66 [Aegilops tauschii subsp. strangulata]